ncbi:OmpH family outer membrane protein [Zunongwangia endophytica]|uniref:OmpH family outer membrane protein n=1 Tax=Zunongwangia endophytica TaxID=1808945 RepID=A0ABV8H5Y7_9FLAO|nr:OmpH family outer membrane protein [Zunongwangia endophytica]MDN3595911.1 OmpH family outer membrane protein [Zunongwangia endophytica]
MKKIIAIGAVAISLISCNQEKTAYVDTTRVIQDYKEMKDVESKFEARRDSLTQLITGPQQQFQQEVQEYQQGMSSMSASQRQAKEQELQQKGQQLQQQQQMIGQQLRTDSDSAIEEVVDKVKDFVADYGEENGYTYIFGSNESANIMYAKEGLDITDEVLEELNKTYGGGSTEASTEEKTDSISVE